MDNCKLKILYEIYDEIIGSIIPGMYFCTYFILCAYFLIIPGMQNYFDDELSPFWFVVPFFAVSYVLGTLFNRGNMEKTDRKSVEFILKREKHNQNNTEFMRNIDDNYCRDVLFPQIDCLKDKHFFIVSLNYLQNEKHFWNIHKKPRHVICAYAYKRIRRAYILSAIFCFILKPFCHRLFERLSARCDAFRNQIIALEEQLNVKINYPYSYLKQYLLGKGLNDLVPYVSWDESTQASKSFVSEYMIKLEQVNKINTSQIKKREAHIRFMNSTYHSQSCLFMCALGVAIFTIMLLAGRFLLYYSLGFEKEPNLSFGTEFDLNRMQFLVNKAYNYLNRIVVEDNLFRILCVSVVYMGFYLTITRRYVLGNFHFQRIREIVYILQLQKAVDDNKAQSKEMSEKEF